MTFPNKATNCTGSVGWMQIKEKEAALGKRNILPSSTCIGYAEFEKTE
jgi:hypothetical protein